MNGAPSSATKLVDKPISVPLTLTRNKPSVLPDAIGWIKFIMEISPTQKRGFKFNIPDHQTTEPVMHFNYLRYHICHRTEEESINKIRLYERKQSLNAR
jgi:hypothetical protein